MMKFSDGWEKFVSDHGIEVNDILVFCYTGDSSFKVSVFDGENCCEREGSHFASNTSSSSQNVTCSSSLHFKRAGDNNGLGTSTPAPAPALTPVPAPAPAAAAAVGSSQKPIVVDEDDERTYNDYEHNHESEYDSATTIDLSEEDYQTESEYQPGIWRRRTRARLYYSTTAYCYAERTSQTRLCFISNRRVPTEKKRIELWKRLLDL
ncbi:B3 domain-containing protein Os03g0622100-like [Chenopodium quinoa]|uniref:B3 domain-containing protein Os03g0622100-like n=1 Tax=Chenopodium quinoa TaxID=63459 RepID=UPI000B790F12|nr:B3 domain-containing protein Os03g0622100-like [Chenopodium quinoa]